jgi:hypothetical protein
MFTHDDNAMLQAHELLVHILLRHLEVMIQWTMGPTLALTAEQLMHLMPVYVLTPSNSMPPKRATA